MAEKKEQEVERKIVFTSQLVNDTTDKINDGVVIKRFQNPWFQNEVGVRRSGLTFMMTDDEIQEYIKCKLDINYFAEKYCRIKTEDGSVQNIKLRDYQRKILDLYTKNRFSILCGSRQIGKCFSFNTTIYIENTGSIRFGVLYYTILSGYRPLRFLEKFKIYLYNTLYRFDRNHKK